MRQGASWPFVLFGWLSTRLSKIYVPFIKILLTANDSVMVFAGVNLAVFMVGLGFDKSNLGF